MADLILSETVARHLAYHARTAAAFAAAGNLEQCASEALLAWTILANQDGHAAIDSLTADLPEPRSFSPSSTSEDAARRRAHALALSLEGHFVSEGQTASADLYEQVAAALEHS